MKQNLITILTLISIFNIYAQNETSNNQKKFKYSGIETIFGISNSGGLANLSNFHFEINTAKNKGLEIGLYIDKRAKKADRFNYSIPYKMFVLNLGYTKQLNFLSAEQKRIATRIAIGGSFGTEILNNGLDNLENGALILVDDGVIYGGYLGAYSTFKIKESLYVVIRNLHFITTSDIVSYKYMLGLGLRFNF